MKELVFVNGEKKRITGEEGKYWLCGDERYRKLSPTVSGVEETPDEKTGSKKRPAKKKKKSTEVVTDGDGE